ncbi:MAG TPA: glycoside hydrolase family 5 protein, partial [Spirochaetota bacterium]|nr:glycoside hydrolase family 5 protein [Spirochaetota bacterium]
MLLKTPNGKPFIIKGIALGNHVWSNPQTSERFTHHGPDDFARIKSMGFNSVRFYLNYGLFENDSKPYIYKQSGFDWIDKNIAAARKHGIYIVLNMHVPQGGFQSNGNGDELWTNPECRARLTALWKEIAKRYSNEDIIIGYGLLNEPVPDKSCEQWKDLAQQITDAVRSVDPNHILFIERVNWLKFASSPSDRENMYFPEIKDPAPKKNIIYEYHAYSPIEFTHQNAGWIPLFKNKFAVYPDSSRINAEGETWLGFSEGNPEAGSGSFEWKNLISNNVKPIKKDYKIGKPVIQLQNIGRSGKIWIDEITIEEFNSAGKKIKTITSSIDGDKGWHFWSRNNSGKISSESNVDGAVTVNCMTASGTTDDAVATLDSLKFI